MHTPVCLNDFRFNEAIFSANTGWAERRFRPQIDM